VASCAGTGFFAGVLNTDARIKGNLNQAVASIGLEYSTLGASFSMG